MKTDSFIAMLSTRPEAVDGGAVGRRYACALGAGSALAALALMLAAGLRPDMASAVMAPLFWLKLVFPLAVMGGALVWLQRLSRPGRPAGMALLWVATPIVVIWGLAVANLANVAPQQRMFLLLGQTWSVCPLSVAGLSVPVFVAVFWALRGLAPVNLLKAGAIAGLLSGAVGAALYALHCTEPGIPFLGTWYLLGMLIPTLAGLLLGPRLLRW